MVDVLVGEDEAQVPVPQRQVVDVIEGEVGVVQAEIEAALADGVGALRVHRPEAVRRPHEHPQGRVQGVGEASRRGGDGEGGQLVRDQAVQLLNRLKLG